MAKPSPKGEVIAIIFTIIVIYIVWNGLRSDQSRIFSNFLILSFNNFISALAFFLSSL